MLNYMECLAQLMIGADKQLESPMANRISFDLKPDLTPLRMSNGLTSVLISVLAIALSDLARSNDQARLAVWIAGRDQSVFGSGCVGFDVTEIPWSTAALAAEKQFMLSAIEAAKNKTGWNKLMFEPNVEWALESLSKFAELISELTEDCVQVAIPEQHAVVSFERCDFHEVYLHEHGCVLCNEQRV
jgi:hypothetical protein